MGRFHSLLKERPAPSTPADRPTEPWQDVYTDLSGKVRTASVTGAKYFAVFVDSYSGSKHIEFMNSKNHFIFGYKRFVSYLGRHPKTLRSDQGTEILNKELTAYLEANHTNHIVCSKDEHASIGAAENSIGVLRTSAKAMMLAGNIPKRYWQFVVSHAAYLNNIVAPSRCDRTKTIFEILFGRRADVRRIPRRSCRTIPRGDKLDGLLGTMTCLCCTTAPATVRWESLLATQGQLPACSRQLLWPAPATVRWGGDVLWCVPM